MLERWKKAHSADKLLDQLAPMPPAKLSPEELQALVKDQDPAAKRDGD